MCHIANLRDMMKAGEFSYGGRKSESQAKFYSGECDMFMGSSASLASIRKNAKFNFGVATLPYYPDVKGAPQNTIIGGASLWVMNGHKDAEYKGVAKFFTTFLVQKCKPTGINQRGICQSLMLLTS